MKQKYDEYYKCYGCGRNEKCQEKPISNKRKSANRGMNDMMIAQAYVPYQEAGELFCPETALMKGTAFPELYVPYKRGTNLKIFGQEGARCHEMNC